MKNFRFGLYTANLNIIWGDSAQSASESFKFFIIPWQILLLLIGIFFITRLIFRRWVAGIKKNAIKQQFQNNSNG